MATIEMPINQSIQLGGIDVKEYKLSQLIDEIENNLDEGSLGAVSVDNFVFVDDGDDDGFGALYENEDGELHHVTLTSTMRLRDKLD